MNRAASIVDGPQFESARCAETIVQTFVEMGVKDVVFSPGSRNAPLAFALHRMDTERRLRLHVRIDERIAGYLALGLSVGSGRPVPVVVTSGTAVANLAPAVRAAAHSHIPLIVVSANRPYHLIDRGGSQTVEQRPLFSAWTRGTFLLAPSVSAASMPRAWRSTVAKAVAIARGAASPPGPVHLDVPFTEPLVPMPGTQPPVAEPDFTDGGTMRTTLIDRPVSRPSATVTLFGTGHRVIPAVPGAGAVTTTVGVALTTPKAPSVAIISATELIRDAAGLFIGPSEPRPQGLTVIVEPGPAENSIDIERICAACSIDYGQAWTETLEQISGRIANSMQVLEWNRRPPN